MSSFFRGIRVLVGLTPLIVAFLRDRKRWIIAGPPARRTERHHQRRAERLVARVAKLGPMFIKLGQLMSTRADIFPEPYLTAIGALQDQAPPDPPDQIIAVIEREVGQPVDDVFDEFEREPVAAASLGQVHRAVVDGREVAVKVLRPGVEELVALDLDISLRLLFWLNVLFPNHHIRALTNVVREFSHRVREEMDFHKESETSSVSKGISGTIRPFEPPMSWMNTRADGSWSWSIAPEPRSISYKTRLRRDASNSTT